MEEYLISSSSSKIVLTLTTPFYVINKNHGIPCCKPPMFKGGKLKFKGSSNNKTKSTHKSSSNEEAKDKSVEIPSEISSIPESGWIKATEQDDFKGPIMFIIPDEIFSIIKVGEEKGNLLFDTISDGSQPDEPLSVANVFVGQNLIPHIFSFKSAYGKYLTSDSVGQVVCNKEAIGPAAEWTLVIQSEGLAALQNAHQKFLSFDRETGRLRCDSETVGFSESFLVKCQAFRKKERLLKKFFNQDQHRKEASLTELTSLEVNEAKKSQSFIFGRHKRINETSTEDLKKAAEEGNIRERLLERRIKSKHDPFC